MMNEARQFTQIIEKTWDSIEPFEATAKDGLSYEDHNYILNALNADPADMQSIESEIVSYCKSHLTAAVEMQK